MEALKLSDLRPEEATFTLQATGDRTFTLGRCSILDREWMLEKWGQEGIAEIFRQLKTHELAMIVMRLMKPEDQSFFVAQDRKCLDEATGEVSVRRIGGAAMLKGLISGPEEMARVFRAVNKTIGISEPIMDKLVSLTVAEEKKSPGPSAGDGSSISSPASTGTP